MVGTRVARGNPIHSVRLPVDLTRRIDNLAAEMGVTWSGALRLLVAKGLGDSLDRALLREKVRAVNAILRRQNAIIVANLRKDLLQMVDEVAPASGESGAIPAPPAPPPRERLDAFGDEDAELELDGLEDEDEDEDEEDYG